MVAKNIWAQLGIKANDRFSEEDMLQWFSRNCKDSLCCVGSHTSWRIIFAFAVWMIWKQRNGMVFNSYPYKANLHKDILFCASEFQYCVLNPNQVSA